MKVGDIVSTQEIMHQVLAAEHEADQVRRGAAAQARDLIKGAEGAALMDERQAAQDLRAALAAFHREKDAGVDREIEAVLSAHQAARTAARAEALKRVDDAARLIVERILTHGDH